MAPSYAAPHGLIAQKLQQRQDAISTAGVYSAEKQDVYLKASASEIVARISASEWRAEEVLEAYIARAAKAHEATNAFTEVMFDAARERARSLDAAFAKTGQIVGPLHGVPMTVKDTFDVTGYDTTLGFTRWIGRKATTNAEAVGLVLDAGAIIFAKTNVPYVEEPTSIVVMFRPGSAQSRRLRLGFEELRLAHRASRALSRRPGQAGGPAAAEPRLGSIFQHKS